MIVQKSVKVLSNLLGRMPEDKRSLYLRFLPDTLLLELQTEKSLPHTHPDLSLKELLGKIDESWYIETLSSFSKKDLLFYLSLFPEKKRTKLAEKFGITDSFYTFSPSMELYFSNLLFKQIFPEGHPLPLSYLADAPLLFLCSATNERLHKLIFYLGLFDISIELKSVLKGSILKSLETTLFTDELAFFREISEFRHIISFGQIGLNQWNEDSDVLRQVIFERGLYRLNVAIGGASPDCIWYITHSLHKSFAEKIKKQAVDIQVIQVISEQLQTAWKSVCTVLN